MKSSLRHKIDVTCDF